MDECKAYNNKFFHGNKFYLYRPEITQLIVQQVVDSTLYIANNSEEIGLQNTIIITNPAQKAFMFQIKLYI